MKKFALIGNGIVKNIIVADDDFINGLPNKNDYVEYTNAGIGWSYDGVNFMPPKCHEEAVSDIENQLWVCANKDHEFKLNEA